MVHHSGTRNDHREKKGIKKGGRVVRRKGQEKEKTKIDDMTVRVGEGDTGRKHTMSTS